MISVVIPAYNEERALPDTLARLCSQPGDYEVILVDGGSTDGTRSIARRHRDLRIVQAPKGRASQMNAGAAKARGEWLLFLHADTLLPENGLAQIAELPREVAAGGFGNVHPPLTVLAPGGISRRAAPGRRPLL
jgi:glycosyltransferase involved in cell wall biosynthesis